MLSCCRFVPDMSSRTEYLAEDDLVVAKFLRRSSSDAFSQTSDSGYLALEHLDTGPKRLKRPAPRCAAKVPRHASAHITACLQCIDHIQHDMILCAAQGLIL
jgi:hypothetical protein